MELVRLKGERPERAGIAFRRELLTSPFILLVWESSRVGEGRLRFCARFT